MSVFFVNSAPEEDVDSPAAIGDGNGNSSSGSADDSNPCDTVQYLDLTLKSFWPKITEEIRNIRVFDVRNQALPLARIKKIMKLDEDVKMISAEAPLLFSKAAEFFIMELTLRAWVHTEDNKRRTLQRSDIAMAINKYEQFDFLIDIVPREEAKVSLSRSQDCSRTAVNSDQIQYYYHLAQQQSESQPSAVQSVATTTATAAPATIVIQAPNSGQISTVTLASQPQEQHSNVSSNNTSTVNSCTTGNGGQIIQIPNTSATSSTGQIIQIPSNSSVDSGQIIQIQNNSQPNGSSTNNGNQVQFFQQVVTPNGDVQHIPIVVLPVQQQQQQRRK